MGSINMIEKISLFCRSSRTYVTVRDSGSNINCDSTEGHRWETFQIARAGGTMASPGRLQNGDLCTLKSVSQNGRYLEVTNTNWLRVSNATNFPPPGGMFKIEKHGGSAGQAIKSGDTIAIRAVKPYSPYLSAVGDNRRRLKAVRRSTPGTMEKFEIIAGPIFSDAVVIGMPCDDVIMVNDRDDRVPNTSRSETPVRLRFDLRRPGAPAPNPGNPAQPLGTLVDIGEESYTVTGAVQSGKPNIKFMEKRITIPEGSFSEYANLTVNGPLLASSAKLTIRAQLPAWNPLTDPNEIPRWTWMRKTFTLYPRPSLDFHMVLNAQPVTNVGNGCLRVVQHNPATAPLTNPHLVGRITLNRNGRFANLPDGTLSIFTPLPESLVKVVGGVARGSFGRDTFTHDFQIQIFSLSPKTEFPVIARVQKGHLRSHEVIIVRIT